jgi:alpha-beta hydrolase superfamily lysophospholipase
MENPGDEPAASALGAVISRTPGVDELFRLTERAAPWRLGTAEPYVCGYAWRHPRPRASLILLHGLQSHAQWFAGAAEGLLARGMAVYALDRRGSGSSSSTRGHISRYADWFAEVEVVVAFAQAQHPDAPVHLVGHCFGANVALGYLLRTHATTDRTDSISVPAGHGVRRATVRSLVMLTPGLYLLPGYTRWEKLRIALSVPLRGVRFRVPQEDGLFSRDPTVIDWIAADRRGARALTPRCLLETHRMLGWLRCNVARINLPVLVVEAARDRIADNRRNRDLLDQALGGRCHWLTFDAEHFLLAEPCREKVLDALVDWTTTAEAGC